MDPRLQAERVKKERPLDTAALEAFEEGRGPLGRALGVDEEDFSLLKEKAISFFEAGRVNKARAVFQMLLSLGDHDPGLFFMLASCADLAGDESAARAYFVWGLDHSTNDADLELRDAALEWGRHLATEAGGA